MTKLITSDHKLNLTHQLYESIFEPANNAYYVCAGNHLPQSNNIPTPNETVRETLIDAYHNMIFGKRVGFNDISFLIRNIPYESKVFTQYDDRADLTDKDFYCIVNESSLFHVYKCLDNHNGEISTVEPQFAFVDQANNFVFETADSYRWKYMYSVTDTVANKFKTDYYFPAFENEEVKAAAVKGAIDVIAIDGEGKGYNNYFNGTFLGTDIKIGSATTLYRVSNNNINWANGYYTGCMIYLSVGTGAGQFRTIENYYSNSTGQYIVLESAFDVDPVNGTEYQVTPRVEIKGSGIDLEVAHARALVNSTFSNSIHKIEILNTGKNYSYATATVVANDVVGVSSNAIVRPIYSPMNGHGADTYAELFADTLAFSITFANTEGNTIPVQNKYQQILLLKDPTFANVVIETTSMSGTFLKGERVVKITPIRINNRLNMNTSSDVVSGETSVLTNVSIIEGGTAGSYIPGELVTVANGTPVVNAEIRIDTTEVRSVTINETGDNNYSNGDEIYLTDGTGTNAVFTVTTDSDGLPVNINILTRGSYTENPTLANAETTTDGSGSGLTLDLAMGVESVSIYNPGAYKIIPTTFANNVPGGGSGSGLAVGLTFNTTGDADFLNQLSGDDYVYLTNPDDSERYITTVNTITNATHLTIASNGLFTHTNVHMYLPNIEIDSYVLEVTNASHITLANVEGVIETGDVLIGMNSNAKLVVNNVVRNGETKGFNTFNNLYKYEITILSGAFEEDEQVYQGSSLANSSANASLHSVIDFGGATYLYTSNNAGSFTNAINIIGATSGAVASIEKIYGPELEFGSGEVLYIENLDAVERSTTQSEQFKIIFEI